jgi:septal ring factor EnvC (AmiA/AmiB activator)
MKNIFLTLILFLMGLTLTIAQKPIEFTDDEVKFGNSQCPGVWVTIPEGELDKVKKDWEKLIEKGSKSKALVNGNEITIFGAMLKDISGATINIFSSVIGQDSVVKLFAAVELTRDVFAVANTPEYENLKSVLKQFSKDQYISVAKDQLSAQEKILKEMEKDISSLRKEQEKLEKGIESANTTISEETYKIATAENQLKETSTSLDAKNNELSNVSPDAKKALESEIKSLEKQKKSLEKDIASSESKISKSKVVIEENTKAVPVNQTSQDELGIRINEQRMVVSNYTQKLANIEAY